MIIVKRTAFLRTRDLVKKKKKKGYKDTEQDKTSFELKSFL